MSAVERSFSRQPGRHRRPAGRRVPRRAEHRARQQGARGVARHCARARSRARNVQGADRSPSVAVPKGKGWWYLVSCERARRRATSTPSGWCYNGNRMTPAEDGPRRPGPQLPARPGPHGACRQGRISQDGLMEVHRTLSRAPPPPPLDAGRPGLRGDRGRRGPGHAQRGGRPSRHTRWCAAPAARPTRRWSTRVVHLADSEGLETLAELWAGAPADSLAGALWRLYLLRSWVYADPQTAAAEFDRGRAHVPVAEVISGVVEPPGSRRGPCAGRRGARWRGGRATSPTRCSARRRSPAWQRRVACTTDPGRAGGRVVVRHGRVGLAPDHPGRPARARGSPRAAGHSASLGRVTLTTAFAVESRACACRVGRASGRGSPGSQIKPLRAATRREALPARRTTSPDVEVTPMAFRLPRLRLRNPCHAAAALRAEARRAARPRRGRVDLGALRGRPDAGQGPAGAGDRRGG